MFHFVPIFLLSFAEETPIQYKLIFKSQVIEGSHITQKAFSHWVFSAKWTQRLYSTLLVTRKVTLCMLNSIEVINKFPLALLIIAHLQSSLSETFKEYLILLKSVLLQWDWSIRLVHSRISYIHIGKDCLFSFFCQTMGPGA